jgi:hypothetical protein
MFELFVRGNFIEETAFDEPHFVCLPHIHYRSFLLWLFLNTESCKHNPANDSSAVA